MEKVKKLFRKEENFLKNHFHPPAETFIHGVSWDL